VSADRDFADRHVMAALAGPIITTMYTGGYRCARDHGWVVAMHESAHASVATALGFRLAAVSVVPGPGALGHCRYRRDGDAEPTADPIPRSDESTAVCMTWLSRACPDWRETRRHLRRLRERARQMVRAELYPIHRLAEVLRARRELAGEEAEQILAAARAELAAGDVGTSGQTQKWHAEASDGARN
jgi:hypothetical protein